MHLVSRLFIGLFALLVAVPVGTLVLCAGLLLDPGANAWLTSGALAGLDMALSDLSAGLPPEGFVLLVAGIGQALFVLLFLPPAIVGLTGEASGARSVLWYGAGTGILTAILPWLVRGAVRPGVSGVAAAEARLTVMLFVVGASAGLAYWAIAGRGAGRDRAPTS